MEKSLPGRQATKFNTGEQTKNHAALRDKVIFF